MNIDGLDNEHSHIGNPQEQELPNAASFIKVEATPNADLNKWGLRAQSIAKEVVAVEAVQIGIEPTIEAFTVWASKTVGHNLDITGLDEREMVWKNIYVRNILYSHAKELGEVSKPEDVKNKVSPQLNNPKYVTRWTLLPQEMQEEAKFDPFSVGLSRQTRKRIIAAREKGYYPGRIGFSIDGVNDFIVKNETEMVLITPVSKLNKVGPIIPRHEQGFGNEREISLVTGVPVEAVDVILPASLFVPRLPEAILEVMDKKSLSPDQRKDFEKQINKTLIPILPDVYAQSLKYTYECTRELLTPKQKELLQKGDYVIDDFWDAGIKPLREISKIFSSIRLRQSSH